MTNNDFTKGPRPTGSTPVGDISTVASRRTGNNIQGGLWLLIVGVLLLAGQLIGDQFWSSFGLFIPLVLALIVVARSWMRDGRPSVGAAWFVFGAAFPALIGFDRLTGRGPGLDHLPAIGLILIGVLVLTGVVRRRPRD